MSNVAEVAVILSLAVVAPIAIITNFIAKMSSRKGLSAEDEKMLADLWEDATRMEERLRSLERILDADHATWRRSNEK
jgi:phage shock protein B